MPPGHCGLRGTVLFPREFPPSALVRFQPSRDLLLPLQPPRRHAICSRVLPLALPISVKWLPRQHSFHSHAWPPAIPSSVKRPLPDECLFLPEGYEWRIFFTLTIPRILGGRTQASCFPCFWLDDRGVASLMRDALLTPRPNERLHPLPLVVGWRRWSRLPSLGLTCCHGLWLDANSTKGG